MSIKRIPPGPGQESVWDYPRPPKLEKISKHIRIIHGSKILVDTNRSYRVLETSHPPVYYFPPDDIAKEWLQKHPGRRSFCEFKGQAAYWDVIIPGHEVPLAAWSYPDPTPTFQPIADYLAFYPSKMDTCLVNDEVARAQEGDFYGGWITKDIVGPFKGGAGTWGW